MEDNGDLTEKFAAAKQLYAVQSYDECSSLVQDCLSDAATNDKSLLAELHLFLAKCHRGRNDLKSAISACESSIEARPKWKDPFLYRSACFQALHQSFTETPGDDPQNIEQDRKEADHIVRNSDELHAAIKNSSNGDRIFLEPGKYESKSSLFLCGKNVTIIGASVKDCVLEFRNSSNQKLETFLICSSSGPLPTLIKRLTFKSIATQQGLAKIKFLGVAGGTVQLEDCMFDATDNTDADAVYTNAKIAGNLAANYPPPYVIARFCVFDSCQSYGAFSAFRSRGSVSSSYFVNCGRSAIVANDCAKLSINHCEFAQTERASEQTLSSSQSDVTLNGCYFHAALDFEYERNVQAVALTCKSVGNVTKNYFFRTGNGISVVDADLTCSNNLILNCCQTNSAANSSNNHVEFKSTLGLFTGLCVKSKGNKVQILSNVIKNCDVGVYVGQNSSPVLKGNEIKSSFFTGVFAECESKPNLVQNQFIGSSNYDKQSKAGLGILLISQSCGLIGKNFFQDYEVSPIMVFSTCHPLLKDNSFMNIQVDEEKQKSVEKQMLEQFQADLFKKDEYFYIVESEITERELQEVILTHKKSQ